MANVTIVHARTEHADYIAQHMRQADVEELQALGKDPRVCLYKGLMQSHKPRTVMFDKEPVLMFGVAPLSVLSGAGVPWLLGTDNIKKIRKLFLKESHTYLAEMLGTYASLTNVVDTRNTTSIRWLKWLGFTFSVAQPLGVHGEPFYIFTMENKYV